MYSAIIKYQFKTIRALKFLTAVHGVTDHSPPLQSSRLKKGLIELWYEKIPQSFGLYMHNSLDADQVKQCTTFQQYLKFFMFKNEQYNTDSDTLKQNRLQCNPKWNTNVALEPYPKKDQVSSSRDQVNTGKQFNRHDNNNNMYNVNQFDRFIDPYSKDREFNSYRYKDTYANDYTEELNDFDFYEGSQKPVTNHNGLDPLYKDINNSGMISDSNFLLLDKARYADLPCFNAMKGICTDRDCHFSHDRAKLMKEYEKRMLELSSSPFAPPQGGRTGNTTLYPQQGGILKNPQKNNYSPAHKTLQSQGKHYNLNDNNSLNNLAITDKDVTFAAFSDPHFEEEGRDIKGKTPSGVEL